MSGWIGFDLDGTLAEYEELKGVAEIGKPITPMIELLKKILDSGVCCKIFTARVAHHPQQVELIQQWLVEQELPKLEVTCSKDFDMILLFDDRCCAVESNTGRLLGGTYSRDSVITVTLDLERLVEDTSDRVVADIESELNPHQTTLEAKVEAAAVQYIVERIATQVRQLMPSLLKHIK